MIKANFANWTRIVILHQDHHPGGKAMSWSDVRWAAYGEPRGSGRSALCNFNIFDSRSASPALCSPHKILHIRDATCETEWEVGIQENCLLHGGRIGEGSTPHHHCDAADIEAARDDIQKKPLSLPALPSPSPLSSDDDCKNILDPVLHCTPHRPSHHLPSGQPYKPLDQGGSTPQPLATHFRIPSPLSSALLQSACARRNLLHLLSRNLHRDRAHICNLL